MAGKLIRDFLLRYNNNFLKVYTYISFPFQEQHEVKSKFLKPLDISSDKELETTSYSNDDSNDNNDEVSILLLVAM